MAKEKPLSKSVARSTKDIPYSKEELKEIEEIQRLQYWRRIGPKKAFCVRNNRIPSELDSHFLKHKRTPDKGTGKKKSGTVITQLPTPAPKEQVTAQPEPQTNEITATSDSFKVRGTGNEIRIRYKSIRFGDGEIIFEV